MSRNAQAHGYYRRSMSEPLERLLAEAKAQGIDRGAARPHQQQLRAADRQEVPTSADRRRLNRIVLDREGFDYRRDFAHRHACGDQPAADHRRRSPEVNDVWPR